MANEEIIKVYTDRIPAEDLKFDENLFKEPEKDWQLSAYDQYLLDLYDFIVGYYRMSLNEFYESSIDDIYYLKDKYLEKLNMDPTDKRSLPLDSFHWGILKTLMTVFSKKKR